MNQIKTFCIAIKDNPISLSLLNDCLESATKFNWKVETFWGVSKNDINLDTWKNYNLHPSAEKKFIKRKGNQGCSLSHFNLWNVCCKLNESIIVLEHDAIIKDSLNINIDCDLIKLHTPIRKIKYDNDTGNWGISTHAYLITPTGANKLIEWSEKNYITSADKMLGDKILNWKSVENTLVDLNPKMISTTNQYDQ